MSFSYDLKQEILENKSMRVRFRDAQAYGLFLFGHSFTEQEISLRTENEETTQLFEQMARQLLDTQVAVQIIRRRRSDKTVFTATLPRREDRLRLLARFQQRSGISRDLLTTQQHLGAFLSGAYLSCGNIADPEKSYHLEFVVRDTSICMDFVDLLGQSIPGVRMGRRRRHAFAYYKECAPIEDLLTLMGATKSCLAVIDIETLKSVRNQANRAVNCETANIDKLVGAAAAQIEDIQFLLEVKGEGGLPEPLLQVAKLRLENPEASLRELSALSPTEISRSGIHHRLDKLNKLAEQLRRSGKYRQ